MREFDQTASELCRQLLPELDWREPFDLAAPANEPLQLFLEHYGFFDTFKAVHCDFFWGYLCLSDRDTRRRTAVYYWRVARPRGTVVVVHGLFDHIGLYQLLIRHCLQQGLDILALDLPGHGLSDGPPTVIDRFDDYADVVGALVNRWQQSVMSRPERLFGVGQSTGAAVLMTEVFNTNGPPPYHRLVFLGPLVQPARWRLGQLAFRLVGSIISDIPRRLDIANSHDAEFHNFLNFHDPLQSRSLSLRWVAALDHWVTNFKNQPVSEIPVLIVQGTDDRVVDWQQNLPAIQAHFSRHQVNIIEGARHHLVNEAEPWRSAIFSSVSQFLRERSGGQGDKTR